MSFFYDYLKYFNLSSLSDKTTITVIVNSGVVVTGNFKISEILDDYIYLSSKKDKVKVYGENLKIMSIAKGEIVISGKVLKIETGEK